MRMRQTRRRRWQALLLGGSLVAVPVSSAHADEIDNLGGDVVNIESDIRKLDALLALKLQPSADAADRRLIDAQVLYELKNYEAASVLLLDIIEKYPNTAAYPEALYYLADSLFQKRDYLSSRRYFEKIVEVGPMAKRYQEALQRLVDLSLHTGDYTPVDGYLAKLEGLPAWAQLPEVPYVKGKYYYFRQKYDLSDKAFAQIGKDHKYWFHAQYFVGASQVARKQLDAAINTFQGILQTDAKTDSQKRIAELSHMALARIYYDRGQLTNANAEYQKISLKSDQYPDALYELAWVAIKGKDYPKAYRSLDILLTARPDDPLAPDVKLLMGNLHLAAGRDMSDDREKEFDQARLAFAKARDEFEPIKKQLDAAIPSDTQAYFKEMIGKNLGKFDTSTYLPPLAIKWVKAEPNLERVIGLSQDEGDMDKSLDELNETIARLEKALNGPSRINALPEMASARKHAVEMANRISNIEERLSQLERDLEAPVVTPDERAKFDALNEKRKQLQAQLKQMPQDAEALDALQKKEKEELEQLDTRAAELNVLIQAFAAERVGIEVYIKTQSATLKIDRDKAAQEIAEMRQMEDDLRKQYEALRDDISDAKVGVGVDDPDMQRAAQLRQQLADIVEQQHELGGSLRARLSGNDRTKVDQIASILDRAQAAEKSLDGFNGRIDAAVDDQIKQWRVEIAEEKAHVAEYRGTLHGYVDETSDVGGGVTAESFKAVQNRFYNIVVRADVGIVDVAWAFKDNKTQEDSRLLRERARELKVIDDEFKPALTDK